MIFTKTPRPILSALPDLAWASGAVFNPGVCKNAEGIHMLFRAVGTGYKKIEPASNDPMEGPIAFDDYVSSIGYAYSEDGLTFTCRKEPFLAADDDYDRFGVEDPRISTLDGTHLITYTALGAPAFEQPGQVRIGLATTSDFRNVTKHGRIGPDTTDKDAVIFPRRIGGRIAMLHRIAPDIQIAYFDDIGQLLSPSEGFWEHHLATLEDHVILAPSAEWERKKVGAGPTPIETSDGWILIYHGVDENHVYRMGIALLDLDNPAHVIARTTRPVIEPEFDFEFHGDVPNVVFPEGAIIIDGTLHVYYGAADRSIGHASASMSDVLALLRAESLVAR